MDNLALAIRLEATYQKFLARTGLCAGRMQWLSNLSAYGFERIFQHPKLPQPIYS